MFDDLLGNDNDADDSIEYIKYVSIDMIDDFQDHPFNVGEECDLLQMSDSIKENGILSPAIIRKKVDGRYEMISGHRRKKACELAMLDKIPCIVKDLSDEEATILMVDSNIQREKVLPSEKAYAYKMKLDALRSQGKRNDLTLFQNETRLDNIKKIGENNNDSRTKVYRYIRLTNLLPDFLDMIDNDFLGKDPRMGLTIGFELSFLKEEEQFILLDAMDCYDASPSHSQAIELKQLSRDGKLNQNIIYKIMSMEKSNQVPKIHISREKLQKVLPRNLKTGEEIENYIIKAEYSKFKGNESSTIDGISIIETKDTKYYRLDWNYPHGDYKAVYLAIRGEISSNPSLCLFSTSGVGYNWTATENHKFFSISRDRFKEDATLKNIVYFIDKDGRYNDLLNYPNEYQKYIDTCLLEEGYKPHGKVSLKEQLKIIRNKKESEKKYEKIEKSRNERSM